MADSVPPADEALAAARAIDPVAAELVEPLLGMTVAPTMISASEKRNVIPGRCEVTVDCRLLPGQTRGGGGARSCGRGSARATTSSSGATARAARARELGTPLWSAIESFVAELEPGARLAPICVAGFTDSHWLREAFGTVAYGFFPMRTMSPELAARLIHSADERIPVDDLELGVEFLRTVAQSVGS